MYFLFKLIQHKEAYLLMQLNFLAVKIYKFPLVNYIFLLALPGINILTIQILALNNL